MSYYTKHIFICTNKKEAGKICSANLGGEAFFEYMKTKLKDLGLHGPQKFRVSKSGCLGRCSVGPSLVIYPEGVWYKYSSNEDIDEIIAVHLVLGRKVDRLYLGDLPEI